MITPNLTQAPADASYWPIVGAFFVNGAGSAGMAVSRLLISGGVGDLILCDRAGAITVNRKERMDPYKRQIGEISNKDQKSGSLADVLVGADVFIGLSAPGTLTQDMVRSMAKNALIFALARDFTMLSIGRALIGLGVKELSVNARGIPQVKRVIRTVSAKAATAAVERAMGALTAEESEAILSSALREVAGDAHFIRDLLPAPA